MVKHVANGSLLCVLALGMVAAAQAQTATTAPATTAAPTASLAGSLGIFAYPAKDQTPEQVQRDDSECYQWASQQTGQNPIAAANQQVQQQPESQRGGQVVGGAAAGAAAGVIIGDTGESAARGAAVNARMTRLRSRLSNRPRPPRISSIGHSAPACRAAVIPSTSTAMHRGRRRGGR